MDNVRIMTPIFVYGTLKRGFPNYSEQRLGAFYDGDGMTVERYALVIADRYYVPVLLRDENTATKEFVSGELYQVDAQTLKWLDKLEGVGQPKGYQRVEIKVAMASGEIKTANTYMKYSKALDIIHNELSSHYALDPRYIVPALRGCS
jgi:gamma-glutamylaminecyclotransferase